MPRGSSRSSSPRSAPAPARSAPAPARVPPPPAARPPAPAPAAPMMSQPQSGGMLSGLASTMAQGFAFGTGSAIAREAVGAVMGGSRSSAPAQQAAPAPQTPSYSGPAACEMDHREFLSCMQRNSSSVSSCDVYYSALQQCHSNSN